MYKLSCKDLGQETCAFEASAESKEDVVGKMIEHAKSAHAEKVEKMMKDMSEEDMMNMMKDAVREE